MNYLLDVNNMIFKKLIKKIDSMYISEQSIIATIRAALEKANLQYTPRYDERAQAEIVLEVNIEGGCFKLMPVTKSIKYSEKEGDSLTIKDYLDIGYLPVSVCSQRKNFWSKRTRLIIFIREESFNEYEPLTSRLDAILVGI